MNFSKVVFLPLLCQFLRVLDILGCLLVRLVSCFLLILLYLLTQVVRQVIQPKIVGDTMGLPPLTTLFLLYMGFKLRGIAGMILAVPVGLLIASLYRSGAFDTMVKNARLLVEEVQKFRRGE